MKATVPKQYLPLLGRPVILHTLERLCSYPRLAGVLVGLAGDDALFHTLNVSQLPRYRGTYQGGRSRAETVLNGLIVLSSYASEQDWVMVHDAVRPCIRHGDIDKLVGRAVAHADGALLAIPVADTLKRADDQQHIEATIPRDRLWRAQTPQLFRIGRLRAALTNALARGNEITDEAAAVELDGGRPYLVEGHEDNIKITLPADLAQAEVFLRLQIGAAA